MPLNGAFWASAPSPPYMAIPYLDTRIPLCPRLLLGAAINPSGRKKCIWSPGLSFGSWLAVDSAPWADFRGTVPRLEVPDPLTCVPPPSRERMYTLFTGGGRCGGAHAGGRPRVPAGSLSGRLDASTIQTPHPHPQPSCIG